MPDVTTWLSDLGLSKYASAFETAEVDLETLPELTEDDLKELGLPLGPRRKILAAISRRAEDIKPVKDLTGERSQRTQSTHIIPSGQDAERRHLTVMFVDLVGSTQLSSRLDIEEMRDVLTTYQDTVAGIIGRFEGFVAKFMGDGVLCYFGWPRANEDDAERAVRAGMAIVEAVQNIAVPGETRLASRAGIATGIVIVGDLVGTGAAQEAAVVGETPNLAARLQECAQINQLVIAEETQRLLGNNFDLQPMDPQTLKGFGGPVDAFLVKGETSAQSRFAARQTGALTPIVGRDREIELIMERWSFATSGQGQMIIMNGEAGIGKSRITQAVVNTISQYDHIRMTCQCSPYHSDSAFYPIIQYLTFSARISSNDPAQTRLQKLEAMLGSGHKALSFLASLLGLEAQSFQDVQNLTPAQRRAGTMEVLTDLLLEQSRDKPVLFIFEDMHWVDPTSLEFLDVLLDKIADHRVMILGTARPTFEHGFGGHPIVTRFVLNRLGQNQIAAIVLKLTDGKILPEEIMSIIAERTDGVPLFVEELTKTILESGVLQESGDRMILSGPLSTVAIPATLHDSLMARLDRLQPIKEVAQTAACIGREFGHELLVQVSHLSATELEAALDGLIKAELIYRRGLPPEATYLFKHALLRDAAYESLLTERRTAIHARIALAMGADGFGWGAAAPESLAHHFTEAQMLEDAIPLWLKAARHSVERSADREAEQQLRKALALLALQPDDEKRWQLELDALTALSLAVMNTSGAGSPNVREILLRADALCKHIGNADTAFPVAWGLWINCTVSGRIQEALDHAERTLELAEASGKSDFLLQAHHAAWTSQGACGDFKAVAYHASEGWRLYDPVQHSQHIYVYGGHDPGACAAYHLALSNWFMGFPDTSRDYAKSALKLVRTQGHPYSIAVTLLYSVMTDIFSRNGQQAIAGSEELIAHSESEDLSIWLVNGRILKYWAIAEFGHPETVIDDFRDALAAREATGSRLRQPAYLGGYARALLLSGRLDDARVAVLRAKAVATETGESTWNAYLRWIEAEIVQALGPDRKAEAAAIYRDTLTIARGQSARSIELRAAIGLAKLFPGDAAVISQMNEVFSGFDEGLETPDLIEAATLISSA